MARRRNYDFTHVGIVQLVDVGGVRLGSGCLIRLRETKTWWMEWVSDPFRRDYRKFYKRGPQRHLRNRKVGRAWILDTETIQEATPDHVLPWIGSDCADAERREAECYGAVEAARDALSVALQELELAKRDKDVAYAAAARWLELARRTVTPD